MLLLALMMLPQQAAASDYEYFYLPACGRAANANNISYERDNNGNNPFISFVIFLFDGRGKDYGFIDKHGGVNVYLSKDGGASWVQVFHARADYYGDWVAWGHDGMVGKNETDITGSTTSDAGTYVWRSAGRSVDDRTFMGGQLYLSKQWRDCNIIFKANGIWSEDDGDCPVWKEEVSYFSTNYTHNVRTISWNGDISVTADGKVTVPYSFGGACNTDGETHICTLIDGSYNSTIGWKSPASNYAAGSYTFKLSDTGKNMRSQFTIQPYHEFTHWNDMDKNNGAELYQKYADTKTFYAMPLATLNNPVFSQLDRNVTLSWTADNTNYGNGKWVIYRNGTMIATVPQNTYTYTDTNFPDESTVSYYVYYVANGWDEATQLSELKSNEVTVNTTGRPHRVYLDIGRLS